MNWRASRRSRSIATVLSITLCLSACGTDSAIRKAAADQADAEMVPEALALAKAAEDAARQLEEQPGDCWRKEHSGVTLNDRQDVALKKTDAALGRANQRVLRCARWNQEYGAGIAGKTKASE